MQLQFDPYAFSVALLALVVAWRAHRLAKRAPELARRQEIRDRIRGELDAVAPSIEELSTAVRHGTTIPAKPEDFDSHLTKISDLSPRVPEVHRLGLLHLQLFKLAADWSSAAFAERELARARKAIKDLKNDIQDDPVGGDAVKRAQQHLNRYEDEAENRRTEAEASRVRVRESLAAFQSSRTDYIDWLDSNDRGRK